MEEKKFELIPSDKEGLFRIKALRDFGNVKKGDIGGYVEGERNLSHGGNCWICDYAVVSGHARVSFEAKVCGNAEVYGNAWIYDNAMVSGNASVYGNAMVFDYAQVFDNAEIGGDANVYDNANVFGKAKVSGKAMIHGGANVSGNAVVNGYASILGDAVITKELGDYMVFHNTWSSGRYFTWTRSNNMWKVGCFYGNGEELIKKAYEDDELKGKMYEVTVKYAKELLNTGDNFTGRK
jgi:carbonic anhydrase/acetyltransferase-like protein (isoleucine patch superfamily)